MPEEQAPYAGMSDKQFIAKGRQRHEACFSVDSHGRPVTFLQGCVYAARHALPEALRRLAVAEAERERLRTEAANKDAQLDDLETAVEEMDAEVKRCNGTVEQLRYALRIAQEARQLGIPPS